MSFYGLNNLSLDYGSSYVQPRYPRKPFCRTCPPGGGYGGGGYGGIDISTLIQLLRSLTGGGYGGGFGGGYQPPVYNPVNPTYNGPIYSITGDPHYDVFGNKFDHGNGKDANGQGYDGRTFSLVNSPTFAWDTSYKKWGEATVNGNQHFAFVNNNGQVEDFTYDPTTNKLAHNGQDVGVGQKVDFMSAARDQNGNPINVKVNYAKDGEVNIEGAEFGFQIADQGEHVDLKNIKVSNFGTGADGKHDIGLVGIFGNADFDKVTGQNKDLRIHLKNGQVIDPNTAYLVQNGQLQGALFGQGINPNDRQFGLHAGEGGNAA